MSRCDPIKTFFMQCRRIEQRIMARLDEYDRYYEMATRTTPSYAGMPSGGTTGSKVERGAILMQSVLEELSGEITALREYRRLARRVIDQTGDQRYIDVLTFRYFNGYSWEQIREVMNYERTQVWRIHGYALAAADRAMQNIIKTDAHAREIYESICGKAADGNDGVECNKVL